ncbi:MAG: CPBP family intramembrane metalloprotease [Oscillospiraceae bacterium]|nr:CPBP family intramembrane metalloprotease [Oscillospiraceae bacterium]
MYVVFLLFVITITFVVSISRVVKDKKSQDAIVTEKMRNKKYFAGIVRLWSMTIAVFIMSIVGGINLADLGFTTMSFSYNIWFTSISLGVCAVMLIYHLHLLIRSLTSKTFRDEMKNDMADSGAGSLIPRTKKERQMFSLMCFSAAICEEIIFRGFLTFLLLAIIPDIPILLVVLIPSAIFGMGHLYQGLSGVVMTGATGAGFMGLFLVTGSLILPFILHFIFNFSYAFVLPKEQTV